VIIIVSADTVPLVLFGLYGSYLTEAVAKFGGNVRK